MAAIKKQSLVDQVYDKLRSDIISLQRPLGSKLNVNEMQEELGVSCTPIREAINRLQNEGLVVYENNVGARVLTLERHDVVEIQQLATTLHCAAVELAMKNADHEVMARELEKHLEDYRKARSVQSEVMAVNRLIGTFYHCCGNARLDKSMISIQGQQLLLRYIYAVEGNGREDNKADFARIIAAVRAGDSGLVCAILGENAGRAEPAILAYIQRTCVWQ